MNKPNASAVETSCADDSESGILSVAAARKAMLAALPTLTATERVALRTALQRILAEEIISPLNVPAHTNSAMDGYAFIGSDLPAGTARTYKVIGTAYAGKPFAGKCRAGECVRIMTGAPLPANCDTVVMQEQVMREEADLAHIEAGHCPGQNVRLAGEDIAAGSVVLDSGRRLTPADLGVIASLGIGEVMVRQRVRVAFFSTGDELRGIGEPLQEGELYDSNRYSLFGMLKRLDVELFDLGVVADSAEALREAFATAAAMADVVITSGGVSVGEADYTRAVLAELGEMNFSRIAMKPGRPLTHGKLGGAAFFGLPGNPVAVMVTFYQFVLPALHQLATGSAYNPLVVPAVCREAIRKRPGRYEFVRGVMTTDGEGNISVATTGQQGSGILTSMSRANCFILLDEDCSGINPGERVKVQPFAALT